MSSLVTKGIVYFLAHFHSLDATYTIERKQCLGSRKSYKWILTEL